MGKTLKKYAIKLPGGVVSGDNFSKILAYSKGEANLFVHNVLEVRMGHHVFKNLGGISNIKTFFADTNFVRDKLASQVSGIEKKLEEVLRNASTSIGGAIGDIGGDSGNILGGGDNDDDKIIHLTSTEKTKVEDALKKIQLGKISLTSVEEAGSIGSDGSIGSKDNDFNAQNINRAKTSLSEGLKSIIGDTNLLSKINNYISSSEKSDGSDESGSASQRVIISESVEKNVNKKLNCMRRWTFDTFEENFNGEMHIDNNHEFFYTKTLAEMLEKAKDFLKKCEINITLKDEYETPEELEADIQVKLGKADKAYKVIEFERYEDLSEEYDED